MSWIFGIIKSELGTALSSDYNNLHSKTLLQLSLPRLYLALGGIDETCFYEIQNNSRETGWAVVGLGIQVLDSGARLMDKRDWKNLFSSGAIQADKLDGHFVALHWNKNEIEIFTDQLGLRTAYYGKCDEGICFSTRLDWVAQKSGLHEINQAALGGRWLLFNQLSYESCVNDIERLGPSSHVVIKNGVVNKHESHPWLPEFGNEEDENAKAILESFVRAASDSGRYVSLGLSGGFDSRTLLAILMSFVNSKFCVHTFGESRDPDVLISENIAREFGIQRQYLNNPIPEPEELVPLVQSFAAQNILVEPASSILRLRYYSQQQLNGQLIIDGGFGEIGRRQYLNRVAKLGRSALLESNVPKLFQLLSTQRADFFTPEFTKEIELAARRNLETTLNDMPRITEIGIENFVDLFSVRTRVPNFGGPEQARADAYIINFMPMVQPSFLRAAFRTDIKSRINGRFYKDIIETKNPRLKKFPLVKSGTTYPYGLPLPAIWLMTKIKNKISKPFIDPIPDCFLMQLKDYVLDIAHSSEVKNWDGYDKNKLPAIIEEYYKGDRRLTKTMDWWLAFELWRRSLFR